LVIAGDWAPFDEHARFIDLNEHFQAMMADPRRFYGGVGEVLRDADFAIVNLECVLGDAGRPVTKDGPSFRLPACAVKGLVTVPFGLACLANNHSMDFGAEGFVRTRQLLAERDIASLGAGLNGQEARRPFVTEIEGVHVVVVNAAEGEEGRSVNDGPGVVGLNQPGLVRQIAGLRCKADVVVAILHAGREFVPVPPPYVFRLYRALVEAGADLVVGHHPHVPQGIEIYQGRLIVYSLGNLALWMPDYSPFARLGYVLRANFGGAELTSAEIVPYRIQASGLALLKGDERTAFLTDLARASSVLVDPSKVEMVWTAYADRWLQQGLTEELIAMSSLLLEEADLRAAWIRALSGRRNVWGKLARRSVRILAGLAATFTDGKSDQCQAQGAAILRNRFATLAHSELYLAALQRKTNLDREPMPVWALDLIERWGALRT